MQLPEPAARSVLPTWSYFSEPLSRPLPSRTGGQEALLAGSPVATDPHRCSAEAVLKRAWAGWVFMSSGAICGPNLTDARFSDVSLLFPTFYSDAVCKVHGEFHELLGTLGRCDFSKESVILT